MRIHRSEGLLLVALVLASSPVLSQDDKFIALDKNRDGFLSRSEFGAGPGNDREAFAKADEDKDGKLTPVEFLKIQSQVKRSKPERSDAEQSKAAAIVEDTLITTKVKAALLKAPDLKSLEVNVRTENGQVVLSGVVQSPMQRDQAVKAASAVDGVKEVKDELTIR